jgi:L-rhamnose-H+ transport protein
MVYENQLLGVGLHAIGGVAHGTFYAPLKKVRAWAWESSWLVQGVAAWVVMPWLVAAAAGARPLLTLSQCPLPVLLTTLMFGAVWGAGSLTFGLSVRYLGMSLGMAVALGYTVALGTLLPPLFKGQFHELVHTGGGNLVLLGVAICLTGIAFCGMAGVRRERARNAQISPADRRHLWLGFGVATFSGIMSSGFAFGIQSGQPMGRLAIANGAPALLQNTPVFIVVMAGGFLVNCLWCVHLGIRNRSLTDFAGVARNRRNYAWAAVAGITWYLGFMFYGMGTTFMGRYDFTSWSIHLAFVIVFSTLCGALAGEWRGVHPVTRMLVAAAIFLLLSSTIVIAMGSRIATVRNTPTEPRQSL